MYRGSRIFGEIRVWRFTFAVALIFPAILPAQTPLINPGGIVPLYSTSTTIQPGEAISIYGSNFATTTSMWTGVFTTSLGNSTVTINNKPGYLYLVSPGQINLQAPDDTATGTVPVVLTTPTGTVSTTVTLGTLAPSFSLLDKTHVAAVIPRPDGSGTQGGGSYDIVGPNGSSLGYTTVAARPGDTVELFGTGYGATSPHVPAGQLFTGAATTTNPVTVFINGTSITPAFAGIAGQGGLYQINVTIPQGLGTGDVPLIAAVGGVQTQTGVVISLQPAVTAPPQVQSVTLSSNTVVGGGSITCTVTLTAPAPPGGATVLISENLNEAGGILSIGGGNTSGSFTISTNPTSVTETAIVTASYGGVSQQATFTITPGSSPAFTSLSSQILYSPPGATAFQTSLAVSPNAGNTTYSATLEGGQLVLVNGTVSSDGSTFSFNAGFASGGTFTYNATSTLKVSTATLTFRLQPDQAHGVTLNTGTLSGTLSVTGTPQAGGSAVTLTGAISGQYTKN
jgi:uncharacterized protein (TIGR03437 family)